LFLRWRFVAKEDILSRRKVGIVPAQTFVSESRRASVNPGLFLFVAWIMTVIDAVVLAFAFPLIYAGYGFMAGGLLIASLGFAAVLSLLKMWEIALHRSTAVESQEGPLLSRPAA
jgi:hypothetical protein